MAAETALIAAQLVAALGISGDAARWLLMWAAVGPDLALPPASHWSTALVAAALAHGLRQTTGCACGLQPSHPCPPPVPPAPASAASAFVAAVALALST